MNPPDSNTHHFKASSHYHARRFGLAAIECRNAINTQSNHTNNTTTSTTNKIPHRSSIHHDRFQVLSKAALEADEALCQFRSFYTSNENTHHDDDDDDNVENTSKCWMLLVKARKTNEIYSAELQSLFKSMMRMKTGSTQNRGQSEDPYIISKDGIDLSLAFLTTGVSGLWLHLHTNTNTNDTNHQSHITSRQQRNDDTLNGRRILFNSIQYSGSCFIRENDNCNYMPSWQESWKIINDVAKLHSENNENDIFVGEDMERMTYVLSSVQNALKIVDLVLPKEANYNFVARDECTRKRKRIENMSRVSEECDSSRTSKVARSSQGTMNSSIEYDKEQSTLGLKEIIMKAIWHRQAASNDDKSLAKFHKEECERYLKQAAKLDCSIVSKRLSSMICIIDNKNNYLKDEKTIDDMIMNLSNVSTKCPLASTLLGCVHAKRGNAQQGLVHFQKALELISLNEGEIDLNIQGSILENMSTCYAMLGHPEPCLELLLQKYSLSTKQILTSKSVIPTSLSLNQQNLILSRYASLWKLYFSSILSGDSATCFDCTKQFHINEDNVYHEVGTAFAILESGRFDDAGLIKGIEFPATHSSLFEKIEYIAVTMNQVEIQLRSCKNNNDVSSLLQRMENCIKLTKEIRLIIPNITENIFFRILEACVMNNHALCLMTNGKNFEALSFANKTIDIIHRNSCMNVHFLQPYINLMLLLMRVGLHDQATKISQTLKRLKITSCAFRSNQDDYNFERKFELLERKVRLLK